MVIADQARSREEKGEEVGVRLQEGLGRGRGDPAVVQGLVDAFLDESLHGNDT